MDSGNVTAKNMDTFVAWINDTIIGIIKSDKSPEERAKNVLARITTYCALPPRRHMRYSLSRVVKSFMIERMDSKEEDDLFVIEQQRKKMILFIDRVISNDDTRYQLVAPAWNEIKKTRTIKSIFGEQESSRMGLIIASLTLITAVCLNENFQIFVRNAFNRLVRPSL